MSEDDRIKVTITLHRGLFDRIEEYRKRVALDRSHFIELILVKTVGVFPEVEAVIEEVLNRAFVGQEISDKMKRARRKEMVIER